MPCELSETDRHTDRDKDRQTDRQMILEEEGSPSAYSSSEKSSKNNIAENKAR